jgi:hypothetical protein
MAGDSANREDGSEPVGGTGLRQDHRAAPPGHEVRSEAPKSEDPEETSADEDDREDSAERS